MVTCLYCVALLHLHHKNKLLKLPNTDAICQCARQQTTIISLCAMIYYVGVLYLSRFGSVYANILSTWWVVCVVINNCYFQDWYPIQTIMSLSTGFCLNVVFVSSYIWSFVYGWRYSMRVDNCLQITVIVLLP